MFRLVDPTDVKLKLSTLIILKNGEQIPKREVRFIYTRCPSCNRGIYDQREKYLINFDGTCFVCNGEQFENVCVPRYIPEQWIVNYEKVTVHLTPETGKLEKKWNHLKCQWQTHWTFEMLEVYLRNPEAPKLLRAARSITELMNIPVDQRWLNLVMEPHYVDS